jgi:hypothetical protein
VLGFRGINADEPNPFASAEQKRITIDDAPNVFVIGLGDSGIRRIGKRGKQSNEEDAR